MSQGFHCSSDFCVLQQAFGYSISPFYWCGIKEADKHLGIEHCFDLVFSYHNKLIQYKKVQTGYRLNDLEYSLRPTSCISLNNTLTMTDVNKVQKSILIVISFTF